MNVQKGTVNVRRVVSPRCCLLALTVDVLSALSYYPDVIIIIIIIIIVVVVFILIAAAVDRWDMSSLLWCILTEISSGLLKRHTETDLLRLSLITV